MSQRFYISPVIGDGLSHETSYRSKPANYGVNHVSLIKSGLPWCLSLVDAPDPEHDRLGTDPSLVALPDLNLDTALGAQQIVDRIKTALTARGIDASGITTATLMREIVRRIGRKLEPIFDESRLGVG